MYRENERSTLTHRRTQIKTDTPTHTLALMPPPRENSLAHIHRTRLTDMQVLPHTHAILPVYTFRFMSATMYIYIYIYIYFYIYIYIYI